MSARISRFLVALWLVTGLFTIPHSPMVAHAETNCSDVATTGIFQAECEALVALYNSTNEPKWWDSTGWNVTNTPSCPEWEHPPRIGQPFQPNIP